jgi:hypothetical protein
MLFGEKNRTIVFFQIFFKKFFNFFYKFLGVEAPLDGPKWGPARKPGPLDLTRGRKRARGSKGKRR